MIWVAKKSKLSIFKLENLEKIYILKRLHLGPICAEDFFYLILNYVLQKQNIFLQMYNVFSSPQ
jgi:hypothetical protein